MFVVHLYLNSHIDTLDALLPQPQPVLPQYLIPLQLCFRIRCQYRIVSVEKIIENESTDRDFA